MAVYGTRVHKLFADEVRLLEQNGFQVSAEQSYLAGRLVKYGTKGSVRVDAVVGAPELPLAIVDLKTGSAVLRQTRIAEMLREMPAQPLVFEIKP